VIEADGSELIAVRRRGLTREQKRALALFDNRTAELATWDFDQLAADVDAGLSLQPFWTTEETAALLAGHVTQGHTDPDALPAPRATAIRPGDVFELGAHRLICGDSMQPDTIARLLHDETAAFVWGDPPYGIALDGAAAARRIGFYGGTAISDTTAPWDAALLADWVTPWERAVMPAGYFGSWSPYQGIGRIEAYALASGLVWLNLFTWIKPNPPPGFPEYLAKSCEHASLYRKPGAGRFISSDFVRDYVMLPTVVGAERGGHPSPKPVAVVRPVVEKLTAPGAILADPFLGSGTMLIVAEQLRRRARVVELSAAYCQVSIDRWEAFSGARAVKVGGA
jgi:DNA modification methylase